MTDYEFQCAVCGDWHRTYADANGCCEKVIVRPVKNEESKVEGMAK